MELWELRVLVAECFLAAGDAHRRRTTRRFKVSVAEVSHVESESTSRWQTSPVTHCLAWLPFQSDWLPDAMHQTDIASSR